MKIVIDARLYGLENAGLGRYVMNLLDGLQKIDEVNHYVILLRKKYFNQLKLKSGWEKVLFDYRHYSFNEQIKLPGVIKSLNPDLVHFPHFNVPVLYKKKFVVTIHDLLMHHNKGKGTTTLNPLIYYTKRFAYQIVFRHAIGNASKIIVPSKYVRNDLLKVYRLDMAKVVVTYEGLDEHILSNLSVDFKKIIRKYGLNKDYFIYVGNAYPHKNLKRAIEAIVLLNEEQKRVGGDMILFVIVTSRNEFKKRLEKIIENLKAQKFVKLLGFVPDEDLSVLYKESLGFLFASLSEGFGLPGLEAMKAGTLAIVSDIPVFKEIYKDKAIFFNPFDFSSIEKALKDVLLMDQSKRRKMVKEGREFIKRYSWLKMAQQTLNVYEEVFEKSQGSNRL